MGHSENENKINNQKTRTDVGVTTNFYGYQGGVIPKVENLAKIFRNLGLNPYIQLHSEPGGDFKTISTELKELKNEFGITYSIHQSMWLPDSDFYINIGSSDDEIWKISINSLKRSIDLADEIGARDVSFHPGYASNNVIKRKGDNFLTPIEIISFDEAYNNTLRALGELEEYCKTKKNNIRINVENLNYRPEQRYLFCEPEDFKRLQSLQNIGVLFDIGHAYFSQTIAKKSDDYIDELIESVKGRISEIHVSDNSGKEDEHKLIGEGDINFKEVLSKVKKRNGLLPPIIIEASRPRYNYTDNDLIENIRLIQKIISGI